jgi:CRISPR/Cas system CMR subunit Cmr4 (Cas7 group RAMP superfamily)
MENHFVIPGSAVKGALHHRTFYHWCEPFDIENAGNRDIKDYYKEAEKKFNELGLFGNETTTNDENETKEGMGQVLVEDVYVSYSKDNETTFMHNAIDRFTQGVMQGALYSENVIAIDKAKLSIQLLVNQESICEELEKVVHAFKKAIEELKNGSLPIGGNTTNGNGFLNEL